MGTVPYYAIVDSGLTYSGVNPATGWSGERCVLLAAGLQWSCGWASEIPQQLMVYPIIYRVLSILLVLQDFFHPQYNQP